jgi:beta-glucanase (GH16 family)
MKKIVLLAFFLFLTGCEPVQDIDNDLSIDCDRFPTHKECKEEPIINESDLYPGASTDFDNDGYGSTDLYTGRDLVPTECNHLDNIGEWQPVWCDEFNYEGLPNTSLWNYDVGGHGWGNNELQYYTNKDLDNVFVKDGVLTIRTIKENYEGSSYTSTRLVSRDKGDWLYGKIQVRAKVPPGQGTWPAIWMLPTDWVYGGWPHSGEIDIMEYVGYDPNRIHGTIHTGAYNHSLGTQVGVSTTVNTAEEEFHVYEMEWEVGEIRLYIDGTQFATFNYDPEDNIDVANEEAWPFDQRFHLLLNTAFGGNWGGATGIDPSITSVDFVIDYVRVYQKDYSTMDEEAPDNVTRLRTVETKQNSAFIAWDPAYDDVLVQQYHIYLDDVLVDTTTVTGLKLTELTPSTTYTIKVVSEDFKGQLSDGATISITTNNPPTIMDRIEAEDYDTMNGIGTETTSDNGGGENVGWIESGDYMTYELIVETTGTYTVDFRISSESNGANFDFYQDNTLLFTINHGPTGGWQSWQTATSPSITLQAGTYTFKIVARGDGFNINYYEFNEVN